MDGFDDVHGGDARGGGLRVVQATEEERAAIRAMLSRRAESAPAGAGVGRAPALAWAGLRLAAFVLLAAGVGIGLGDGDEFDDVGCTCCAAAGRDFSRGAFGPDPGACRRQAGRRRGRRGRGRRRRSCGPAGGARRKPRLERKALIPRAARRWPQGPAPGPFPAPRGRARKVGSMPKTAPRETRQRSIAR